MTTIFFQNLGWLLVLIGVMIIIHELGHYWAARFFDVRVDTFSFGFGPRLFGFRKGETDFRFSAVLFGGYVRMAGEQPGDENINDPRAFLAKPRWQRLIISFAGPFMNIVLAVVLLTGLFMFKFPKTTGPESPVTIAYVAPGSAAEKAGVQPGDIIERIDNEQDPSWEDVFLKEIASANREVFLVLRRDGEQILTRITPALDERSGSGYAGWTRMSELQIYALIPDMGAGLAGLKPGDVLLSIDGKPIRSTVTLHQVLKEGQGKPVEILYARNGVRRKVMVTPKLSNLDGSERWMIGVHLEPRVTLVALPFDEAVRESIRQNIRGAGLIYQFLRGIVERRLSARSLEGPIRMAQLSGDAAREGAAAFISLMAMVSLNLAVFNLLPIPILDGGVILLLLVEMLMRKDLSLSVKETVFKLGFVFLMAMVAFVIYNDIQKVLPPGQG